MGNLNDLLEFNNVWRAMQQKAGVPNPKDLQFPLQATIDSPLNLYVDLLGDDNNPGTIDRPFRNIQAATNLLAGCIIRSAVIVNVGAGIHNGFTVGNLDIRSLVGSNQSVGVNIIGTTVASTLTTGTASGTFTGANFASSNVILTDSTQNWTVNELKGKYLATATFGDPNDLMLIAANTNTTLTLCGGSNPGVVAYNIVDLGTFISRNAPTGGGNRPFTTLGNIVCLALDNSDLLNGLGFVGLSGSAALRLKCLHFDLLFGGAVGTGTLVRTGGTGAITFDCCKWKNGTTATRNFITGTAAFYSCFFDINGTGSAVSVSFSQQQPSSIVFLNCYVKGASAGVGLTSANPTVLTQNSLYSAQSFYEGLTTAISISGPTNVSSNLNTFLSNTNCFNFAGGPAYGTVVTSASQTIANSSNTNFFSLVKGVRVQVDANTLAGATNEITLDGVVNTLATMRAASPKLLTNTYGTIIYE